jgi:hypothetical protein
MENNDVLMKDEAMKDEAEAVVVLMKDEAAAVAVLFKEAVRFLGEQNTCLHEQVSRLSQLSLSSPLSSPCKVAELIPTSVEVLEALNKAEAEDVRKLMLINAQMFGGTLRLLFQQNMDLYDRVSALTADLLACVVKYGSLALLRQRLESNEQGRH